MTEYLTEIPAQIKTKVEDKDWAETFKFEVMPCSHGPDAKEYEKQDCIKCKIDTAEKWAEDTLTQTQPDKTTKYTDSQGNEKTGTLNKIVVKRGKFDDCQGFEWHWNP